MFCISEKKDLNVKAALDGIFLVKLEVMDHKDLILGWFVQN